jgi:putative ABC transport system permease protein
MMQDLRYSLRLLKKSPGFVFIAVLTLALGIGANTAIFSVVNGVLLRPLPYPAPERVVRLFETATRQTMSSDRMEVAPANFLDWQTQAQSFSGIAAYGYTELALADGDAAQRIEGALVSANLFSVLGVQPLLGRAFNPTEERAEEYLGIISYDLWQRRYGGAADIVGRQIQLDGYSFTVIGVMPPGFSYPRRTEVWELYSFNANQRQMREARFLKVVARLQPGVTVSQAQSEMAGIAQRLAEQYPQTNQHWGVQVVSLLDEEVGRVRPTLLVLLGVVALVLLIACANVANLLLARASTMQTEIAVRLALGAGRWRIVRQLLTESLLLAALGGAAGLLLASWGIDGLVWLAPEHLPRVGEVRLDGRVLAFTTLVALATGLLFGLLPALQATRVDLNTTLKEGKVTGGSRAHWLDALVVAEIALALIVLAGAGLLINSFLRLRQVDSGLDAQNVLTVKFTAPAARYNHREHWRENRLNFFNQLIPRIERLPGVEAVGGIDSLPLSGGGRVYRFRKDNEEPAGYAATFQVALGDYFRAVGIRLQRGRRFGSEDQADAPPVVIINETMQRRFWPNQEAIGQRIVIRNETFAREIIGVVNDVKHFGLDKGVEPEMYVPFNQLVIQVIPLVIRTQSDPLAIANAVRAEVRAVDPTVAVAQIQTMPQIAASALAQRRFTVLLLTVFAGVALLLAAVGIYGVMSFSVAQRTREIGVRLALGAQARDVLRLIVGRGLRLTLFGIGVGLLAALALTRLMSGLLFGVSATDPLTFGALALLLSGVALVACWLPARRATKIDPLVALRYE